MWPSLNSSIPLLCIDNIYDYYKSFLNRDRDSKEAIDFCQNLCARFMLNGGLPKLVVCQKSLVNYNYLREHLGLKSDICIVPDRTAGSTVEKIIQCSITLDKIVAFSGASKNLQIIAWAGTSDIWNLAQHLEGEFGIKVILPETPLKENLWIQQYLDTKHGFRSIVSATFCPEEEVLTTGFICLNETETFEAIKWFLSRNVGCIVKPSRGVFGKGILLFEANMFYKENDIRVAFGAQKHLFAEDLIIVEQRVNNSSNEALSPSVEYFIPPQNKGNPIFTYLVNQVFHNDVCFVGNIISKEQYSAPWCPPLLEKADRLARKVQELGYVGYMDIDCVVDDNHNAYFVEINPRRTGGTHIHELTVQLFGENYIQEIALISNAHLKVREIRSFEQLYAKTIDLLYVPNQIRKGIIIINANLLSSYGIISVLSIGKDESEAANCLLEFQERVYPKDIE